MGRVTFLPFSLDFIFVNIFCNCQLGLRLGLLQKGFEKPLKVPENVKKKANNQVLVQISNCKLHAHFYHSMLYITLWVI